MNSIRWLETYLSNYRGTVLIVSHDRYFLDRTVTRIIELENTKCTVFNGNYSFYAEQKKALREQQRKAWLNNQAEIRHQEEVIAKLRRFNREKSIRRAESREKMPCIKSGREVMHVENLAKSFDDKVLFTDLSFQIRRGEHVALIGDNGTGKTTILKIINELLPPDGGHIRLGTNVHIGYYDQEHHVLTDSNTVFEEISDAYPSMTNTEIRNLLASFLFTGEDVFKQISDLSGGEKGRVSLAKLMLSQCNFLILDEPTNHLDLVSKEVLENALNSYTGTILYVSVLLNYPGNNSTEVPDRFIGNYDFYLEKSAQIQETLLDNAYAEIHGLTYEETRGQTARAAQKTAKVTEAGQDWKRQKEEQARKRKAANDLRKCEERIAALEADNLAIDEDMGKPEVFTSPDKLRELTARKEANEAELETLYETWEELSENQE